jgi:plasmid stabilization system protein ParE
MPKPVRVDPEAEEEIAAGIAWYEARRAGLGREFLDEVRAAIRSLATPGPECRPALGISTEFGVRRKLLRRFPYVVLFVEFARVVRIIAVAHAHRRPGYWKTRA